MNRNFAFALVFAFAVLLAACNGDVPTALATNTPTVLEPTAATPTDVPPTEMPSVTSTSVPIAVLTEFPIQTPTAVLTIDTPSPVATQDPTAWDVAQQMLAECFGAYSVNDGPPPEYSPEAQDNYLDQLWAQVSEHSEIWKEDGSNLSVSASLWSDKAVLANDGVNPNPFAMADRRGQFDRYGEIQMTFCEGYILVYDGTLAENADGDGILVGEAYLFYEVGGTQPYVLDGELKEVRFTFPPTP